jgi:outer membrane murein-binding lipoprotein Lpp
MKCTRLATSLIAAALMTSPALSLAQNSQKQNTPAVQDWNTPPAGTEQSQQAYRDGIEAAKLDKAAKRTIDAKVSHLYKKPPVKKDQQDAYRSDFEKGYQAQVSHDSTM